jgi:hypothetical protein
MDEVQGPEGIIQNGTRYASGRVRHRERVSEGVPRLFAPREIVLLEQLLRGLREATNGEFYSETETRKVVTTHRDSLPELHAFVRGMIYGL